MKNIFFILISSILLTSCSKNIIKDITVSVDDNGFHQDQPAFSINAEYTPENFGENIEDFGVEIIVTATPVTDLSTESDWLDSIDRPTLTKIVTLHNDDFIACRGEMVHGLGYHFDKVDNAQGYYNITYTKRML